MGDRTANQLGVYYARDVAFRCRCRRLRRPVRRRRRSVVCYRGVAPDAGAEVTAVEKEQDGSGRDVKK